MACDVLCAKADGVVMSATQRRIGQDGEREVAAILRDHLGLDVTRNWQQQSAVGGMDLSGVNGWAPEVKLKRVLSVQAWWRQTLRQAEDAGAKPVLIYRQSGAGRGLLPEEKWTAVYRPADVGIEARGLISSQLLTWMDLVRETL
jgi:hypothetical protein